jgi:hypothetical protein
MKNKQKKKCQKRFSFQTKNDFLKFHFASKEGKILSDLKKTKILDKPGAAVPQKKCLRQKKIHGLKPSIDK